MKRKKRQLDTFCRSIYDHRVEELDRVPLPRLYPEEDDDDDDDDESHFQDFGDWTRSMEPEFREEIYEMLIVLLY